MATKKYCDRCTKEIVTESTARIEAFVVDRKGAVSAERIEGIPENNKKADLCLTCHKECYAFIMKEPSPVKLVSGGEPVAHSDKPSKKR